MVRTISRRYANLREAHRAAKATLQLAIDHGQDPGPEYVLRPDGDTDRFSVVKGKIVRKKFAGWITLGCVVPKSETPCIVS